MGADRGDYLLSNYSPSYFCWQSLNFVLNFTLLIHMLKKCYSLPTHRKMNLVCLRLSVVSFPLIVIGLGKGMNQ